MSEENLRRAVKLREDARNRISALKSIERIMSMPNFLELFARVDSQEQHKFQVYMDCFDPLGAKSWYKTHMAKSRYLGEMTVIELRKIAQQLNIENYFRLPKAELLSEIEKCKSNS